ncbi:MAG: DUF1338 domain-containing protein [Bdellovibrionota bacterium]
MDLQNFLSDMWKDYCDINPQAAKIHQLLTAQGEKVVNDHIALRTFNHPRLGGIKSMAKHFLDLGYIEKDEYFFKEKKLYARHYEHKDGKQPKIFISELELEKMSPFVQKTVDQVVSQMDTSIMQTPKFIMAGRPWEMNSMTYEKLALESEYASWVAAWGFRPNHFTVSVNHLNKFKHLPTLNTFLKAQGFKLNGSGGEIKGTPRDYLEQSSTMAADVPITFNDGSRKIPGCYYEFALRHRLPNGEYYQGFVAKSADKIFESTNRAK